MKFWEAVKIAMGMKAKGLAPEYLVLDKIGGDVGFLKVDWKAIAEITKDEVLIARMINDLFIERRIMYVSFARENTDFCIQSLTEMHSFLKEYLTRFDKAVSEKDRFYASLLLEWQSACKITTQELLDAKKTEGADREAYKRFELLESSDILRADEMLPEILFSFRVKCYPIVSGLLDLLPDSNISKEKTKTKLTEAKKLLLQYKTINEDELEPNWDIVF